MDVTKLQDIKAAQKVVQDKVGIRGLNLLINNAGFAKLQGFPEVTEESFSDTLPHQHCWTIYGCTGIFAIAEESSRQKRRYETERVPIGRREYFCG
ncbi:putative oxidoreductase [Trichonephila clavata]|uniref:Putative oxidoreductase n=1 Tax=Trichonephila clavata TaxID=2740835 RepID=A0A8X6M775_TRICU|nr:putative oxidoreductase [Trichonephila clavata]